MKRLLTLLLFVLPLASCNTVDYWEKQAFTDPVMNLGDEPTEVHWYQKVYYSGEGAVGGIGTAAGGGCGCY